MTNTTKTAKERLDDVNAQIADTQAQQERLRQLYASAVSAADGAVMAKARLDYVALEEQMAALNLQAQQCLIDEAQERLGALGQQEEALQEELRKVAGPLQAAATRYSELQGHHRALEAQQEDSQRQRVELRTYIENVQRSLQQMQAQCRANMSGW